MNVTNVGTGHGRNLRFTGMPDGTCPELEISVTYRGNAGVDKAITLDHTVIPAIKKGVNCFLPAFEILKSLTSIPLLRAYLKSNHSDVWNQVEAVIALAKQHETESDVELLVELGVMTEAEGKEIAAKSY